MTNLWAVTANLSGNNLTANQKDSLSVGEESDIIFKHLHIKLFLENNNTRRFIYVYCRNIQNKGFLFWTNS